MVHATFMLCVCMWVSAVYIMCGLHAQMLPVCTMLYNVHVCMVRVYGLCGCVCTVGCVCLVRVYYLHIVYVVCVHCLVSRELCMHVLLLNQELLVQS